MSDIHIETLENYVIEDFITPTADILILAGDIGRVTKYNQLEKFLQDLCPKFKLVLYVLGNHEYYRVEGMRPLSMEEILQDINNIATKIPNLYILNRNSIIIGDVCIAGCTLWSRVNIDIPPYIVKIPRVNSYKYNYMFNKDFAYIQDMVKYCQKNKLKLVVVTHHCPTFAFTRRYGNDKFRSLYCTDLEHMLDEKNIHTWICGHVHINFDVVFKNGTRLVSNQRGKGKDNITDFSLTKVIEI
jgi:hypothetical protein